MSADMICGRGKGLVIGLSILLPMVVALVGWRRSRPVEHSLDVGAAGPTRDLSGRLIRAQEEERSRIARELHDDICQQLALLVIDLRRIRDSDCTSTTCKERLSEVCSKVNELSKDVHDLSHRIHSTKLNHLGLAPALRDLSNEFSQQYQINVECRFHDLPAKLDANTSLILFRVAQEALTNMAKHSKARHGLVELNASGSEAVLRVADDGVGFEQASISGHNHLGFISMHERLRTAGGVLTIRSQPSMGTQIEARVPLWQVSSGGKPVFGSRAA